MADSMASGALKAVQVEALVVMKIIKHCSAAYTNTVTGSIVGLDKEGTLQVSNSFPFPTPDPSAAEVNHNAVHELSAAAPRTKANIAYQNEMIKYLREVNVDANNVGWYTSTSMGNFINQNFVENQYHYQRDLNEKTVALVYDASRSVQGSLSLRAFRLSPVFMTAFKENKFTTEILQKSGLRYQDIFIELPVTVHNSHLLTSLLHDLPSSPALRTPLPPVTLSGLTKDPVPDPLTMNFDTLDLSMDPFLEKTCELLLDTVENHHIELNNHQYYQRALGREQAKITAWQTKRRAENAARTASKQPLLPEDEWQRLFKLPQEPSRLEIMLNSSQVEQFSRQVDHFAPTVSAKMFGVRTPLRGGER